MPVYVKSGMMVVTLTESLLLKQSSLLKLSVKLRQAAFDALFPQKIETENKQGKIQRKGTLVTLNLLTRYNVNLG